MAWRVNRRIMRGAGMRDLRISPGTRLAGYRIQARYIFSHLSFHIIEGLRYGIESSRRRRHLDRLPS
jgi:hypothetical protein